MPITKRTELDQLTIDLAFGTVLWRETTVIEDNGVEIARTHHRGSAEIDRDENDLPPEARPYRRLVDTPQRRAAQAARKAEAAARIGRGA